MAVVFIFKNFESDGVKTWVSAYIIHFSSLNKKILIVFYTFKIKIITLWKFVNKVWLNE